MRCGVILLCLFVMSASGCDRLQSPTRPDCGQAVTNLVSKSVDGGIESAFPSEGDGSVEDMASNLLKGVGKQLLTSAVVALGNVADKDKLPSRKKYGIPESKFVFCNFCP